MTAKKRILSLFLCIVMLIPCFIELFPAVLSAENDGVIDLYVTYEGVKTTEISLVKTERAEISAVSFNVDVNAYRWQICYDIENDGWAYIYDKTGETIEISRGLFETIVDNEYAAYIRAVVETDFGRVYSAAVKVVLTDAPEPVSPELLPEYIAPKKIAFKSLLKLGASPDEYVNITVNYLSADDPTKSVYAPYTAKIARNATLDQNVISPSQIGFAPYHYSTNETHPADGEEVTVTVSGETRTYTYSVSEGKYIYADTAETNETWLSAIDNTFRADTVHVEYNGTGEASEIVYNVYYKAIDVPYSVKYYFQNVNDDGYTQNAAISANGMAKTGTIVSDDDLKQAVLDYYGVSENDDYGFTALYHYPEAVAADGSTIFECYYDRNYYLIKFDMDGGYGVEPIYARYGASFVVTPPTKPGYQFAGWDRIENYDFKVYTDSSKKTLITTHTLNVDEYAQKGSPSAYSESFDFGGTTYPNAYFVFDSARGNGVADEATTEPHTFTGTIKAERANYKALWNTVNTTYTIVYWAENADDTNYSYWGNKSVSAQSATVLSDYDAIVAANTAADAGLTDAQYFTYDSKKTKFVNGDGVIVEGDGSTVINVYYSRNTYDILFYDSVERCHVPEHTHTDECYDYDCTDEHVHTADCYICGMTENPHTDACCSLEQHTHTDACLIDCPIPEHTHTNACYTTNCIHVHNADCCSVPFHDHTSGCTYTVQLSCTDEEHTHTAKCFGANEDTLATNSHTGYGTISGINNPVAGQVYCYRSDGWVTRGYLYLWSGSKWYYLGNDTLANNNNTQTISAGRLSWTGTRPNNGAVKSSSGTPYTVNCGKDEHTHDSGCYICPGYDHEHSISCYTTQTGYTLGSEATDNQGRAVMTAISNPQAGHVYRYKRNNANNKYIWFYDGSTWYYLGNGNYRNITDYGTLEEPSTSGLYTVSSKAAKMICGKVEHTHKADGSCCTKTFHDHTSGCNTLGCTHVCSIENGCITLTCGQTAHTHSETCYYRCHKVAHTHTNACYTVTGSYRNNGSNFQFKLSSTALDSLSNIESVNINGNTLYYNSKESDNAKYLYYKIGDKYYQLLYGTNTTITFNNYNNNKSYYNSLSITPCTMEEHTHTDSCYNCGLTEHTHGDGNCNALACDDDTHHVHTDECLKCEFSAEHVHSDACPRVLVCTQAEHEHDSTCQLGSRYLVYKISAKYNADIHGCWPAVDATNGKTYSADAGYRWNPQSNGLGFEQVLVYIDRMPGMANENGHSLKLVPSTSTANRIDMHYCVQTIPNDPTAEYTNYLGNTATVATGNGGANGYQFVMDYRFAQAKYSGITTDVDFIDLEGFEKYWLYTNGNVNEKYRYDTDTKSGTQDYFYYLRKQYTLSFYNYNADWGTSSEVYYEQNMTPFVPAEPDYPNNLEPNAYEFAGWYTTPECYAGTEFDLTAVNKMPAKDVKLYAKWVPVTHTVRFFETYDIMLAYEASVAAGTPNESLVYVKQTMTDVEYTRYVEHGDFVGSIPNPDNLVDEHGSTTLEYDFCGWFMIENEAKKAFTPLDMPVTRDLNIFADWGTHTAQPYAVHYALEDYEIDSEWLELLNAGEEPKENQTKNVSIGTDSRRYIWLDDGGTYHWHLIIADDTRGYAYQGTTRTFNAKAGEPYGQLYSSPETFNSGYYPTPSSHSITMMYEENSLEPKYNVFTFRYVNVSNVEYRVRYLDATTKEELHEEKHVENVTDAVVTERFVPIVKEGHNYIPDAVYKQCILAVVPDPLYGEPGHTEQYISSPENVITFYYSENDTSARYTVHFMLQKADEASRTLEDSDFEIDFDDNEHSDTYGTYTFSPKFEESGSRIDAVADIGTPIEISPIEFAGFDLVTNKAAQYNGPNYNKYSRPYDSTKNVYTITPVVYGTDLFLFYTREEYPYKVYYLRYGAPVSTADLEKYVTRPTEENDPNYSNYNKWVLADTKTKDEHGNDLTALYGTDYTETAPVIKGYTLVSASTISKAITPIDESNYIVFFYTPVQYTVQYEVVGEGGELSETNETVENINDFKGSTATAKTGYRFVGWFVDEACTIPATWIETTNPGGKGTTYTDSGKTTPDGSGAYVYPEYTHLLPNGHPDVEANPNIFYAKFEPLIGDLTITRDNSENEGEGDQTFVYEVKNNTTNKTIYVTITGDNSVTIHGLLYGDYTVTQIADWSHRFDDAAQDVTLNTPTGTEVTFDDDAVKPKWLNGNGVPKENKKVEAASS